LYDWARPHVPRSQVEAKLADPADPDDKKWTALWLKRFTLERNKKLKGAILKIQSKRSPAHRWKDLT